MATFNGTLTQFINATMMSLIAPLTLDDSASSPLIYTPRQSTSPKLARVVCDGNSITIPYAPLLDTNLATSQASHPAQVCDVIDSGTGSTTTLDMIAAFEAEVQKYFNPDLLCVDLFQELTNQIRQGGVNGTFEAVRDAAIAYCELARANGWWVFFLIPTPRASITDPGYGASLSAWSTAAQKTIYEQVCAYFRANTQHYDVMVDMSAVPELANPLDTIYYQADGVHLTAAGSEIMATTAEAALIPWFLTLTS